MRIMYASVSRNEECFHDKFILPSTYEIIEDRIQKVNGTMEEHCIRGVHLQGGTRLLEEEGCRKTNIFELNYLAKRLQDLDLVEYEAFQGATKILLEKNKNLEFRDLMNICENIKYTENIEAYPTANERELGEFFIDNKMIKELENLSDEQFEWVSKNLNTALVGKEISERMGGVFTGNAFVSISSELENLYDDTLRLPEQSDYIFKLKIATAPVDDMPNDEKLFELKFPTTNQICKDLLEEMGADKIEDCVFYGFHNIYPSVDLVFEDMRDFEKLNELAVNLEYLRRNKSILTFKAMTNKMDEISVDEALDICGLVKEFEVDPSMTVAEDYGRERIKNLDLPEKEMFLESVDLSDYGEKLMKQDGVVFTDYGALKSQDGLTLEEKLLQMRSLKQVNVIEPKM